MANYYNVRGWKNTGLNEMHRPFSPSRLTAITDGKDYFQMSSIQLNRDDIYGMDHIDVQGSVKDSRGSQIGTPSKVGPLGPGGPWYDLEEVDYLCIIRTGYPGDDDYVDIGSAIDAWTNDEVKVAFFFVGTPIPISRNVTRLPLRLDSWTTMMLDTDVEMGGFKIRGPITDVEDKTTINTASEDIGLSSPLFVRDVQFIDNGEDQSEQIGISISAADLTHYDIDEDLTGFLIETNAQGSLQKTTVPRIYSSESTEIEIDNLDAQRKTKFNNLGFYNPHMSRVQYNLQAIYSFGNTGIVVENYEVPSNWIDYTMNENGLYTNIKNKTKEVLSPVQGSGIQDIYPRKATYMFAQMVLVNEASGDMDIQPIYNLPDFFGGNQLIEGWSIPLPGGCPCMRFKNIKDHPLHFDKVVQGGSWQNQSLILEGAAGSEISQYNLKFALQQSKRQLWYDYFNSVIDIGSAGAGIANMNNQVLNALDQNTAASMNYLNNPTSQNYISQQKTLANNAQLINNLNVGMAQSGGSLLKQIIGADISSDQNIIGRKNAVNQFMLGQMRSPLPEALPSFTATSYTKNRFAVMLMWPTQTDQLRARNALNLMGYRGLYKPLNKLVINVKANVNYCQTEDAWFRSNRIPQRVCNAAANVINNGCWFWNVPVDFTKFANQADNN